MARPFAKESPPATETAPYLLRPLQRAEGVNTWRKRGRSLASRHPFSIATRPLAKPFPEFAGRRIPFEIRLFPLSPHRIAGPTAHFVSVILVALSIFRARVTSPWPAPTVPIPLDQNATARTVQPIRRYRLYRPVHQRKSCGSKSRWIIGGLEDIGLAGIQLALDDPVVVHFGRGVLDLALQRLRNAFKRFIVAVIWGSTVTRAISRLRSLLCPLERRQPAPPACRSA